MRDKVEQRENVAEENQDHDAERRGHLEQRGNVGKNIKDVEDSKAVQTVKSQLKKHSALSPFQQ